MLDQLPGEPKGGCPTLVLGLELLELLDPIFANACLLRRSEVG